MCDGVIENPTAIRVGLKRLPLSRYSRNQAAPGLDGASRLLCMYMQSYAVRDYE
jgi:hypothetical protein